MLARVQDASELRQRGPIGAAGRNRNGTVRVSTGCTTFVLPQRALKASAVNLSVMPVAMVRGARIELATSRLSIECSEPAELPTRKTFAASVDALAQVMLVVRFVFMELRVGLEPTQANLQGWCPTIRRPQRNTQARTERVRVRSAVVVLVRVVFIVVSAAGFEPA